MYPNKKSAAVVILLIFASIQSASGAMASKSEESLTKNSTYIIEAKIVRIYSSVERDKKYKKTSFVAELDLTDVQKGGDDLRVGDRLYVRYWKRSWIGGGDPEPGHYGHRMSAKPGQTVRVYLKGDRSKGLDVLEPNGMGLAK